MYISRLICTQPVLVSIHQNYSLAACCIDAVNLHNTCIFANLLLVKNFCMLGQHSALPDGDFGLSPLSNSHSKYFYIIYIFSLDII